MLWAELCLPKGFSGGSVGKEPDLLTLQEMKDGSWGQKDLLEKDMATQSSILAWEIQWTEEPGGPQSIGSQRVR